VVVFCVVVLCVVGVGAAAVVGPSGFQSSGSVAAACPFNKCLKLMRVPR
jgi:hypothetical protein